MNVFHKVTIENLKKNKTRTVVTIIGVVLSAAMITGVIAISGSIQHFLVEGSKATVGDWYAMAEPLSENDRIRLVDQKGVTDSASYQIVGYAKIKDPANKYKPYIFVTAFDKGMYDVSRLKMMQGRKPRNSGEIVLPEHLMSDGGQHYTVGSTITLKLGKRAYIYGDKGKFLGQTSEYAEGTERIEVRETRTYKVVGICQRIPTESYPSCGYTAVTAPGDSTGFYGTYIKTKDPADIYATMKTAESENAKVTYNRELLTYLGANRDDGSAGIIKGLEIFLIGLIMLGSVSLIYNAFSISVSERTKELGMLSSAGATKRQIRETMTFEALLISGAGIPIGVLIGTGGTAGILYAIRNLVVSTAGMNAAGLTLKLYLTAPQVVIIFGVSLLTVLISSFIPAFRASKMSVVEAIRQTRDIKVRRERILGSALVYRLFGIEGILAAKNFKRNRKQYRATVLSLIMSIVLFISASAYTKYLTGGVEALFGESDNYDIVYNSKNASSQKAEEEFKVLAGAEGVTGKAYSQAAVLETEVAKSSLDKETLTIFREYKYLEGDKAVVPVTVFAMDSASYRKYVNQQGLGERNPKFIALREGGFYDAKQQRYRKMTIYKSDNVKRLKLDYKDETYDIPIDAFVQDAPAGAGEYASGVLLVTSEKNAENIFGRSDFNSMVVTRSGYFKSENTDATYASMLEMAKTENISQDDIVNVKEEKNITKSLMTVVNIFAYGFIILISLIAVANVFNTISTNVLVRRREFAMLKAVGMSDGGFMKMMNYECIIYGAKALLYGLPAAAAVTYVIYRTAAVGMEVSFSLPVQSVVISILSIFFVVFSTMIYATHRIEKEDTMKTVKIENV